MAGRTCLLGIQSPFSGVVAYQAVLKFRRIPLCWEDTAPLRNTCVPAHAESLPIRCHYDEICGR